jgi:phosphate transport system substrate-binding protein
MNTAVLGIMAGSLLMLGGVPDQPVSRPPVDETLPSYQKTEAVSGTLVCAGAAPALVEGCADAFEAIHSGAKIAMTPGSPEAAAAALVSGTAQIAILTRPMTDDERQRYEQKFQHPPAPAVLGADAVLVYLNAANPLTSATLADLRRLFAETGGSTWSEFGVVGEFAPTSVSRFGLRPGTDGADVFQRVALGDLRPTPAVHLRDTTGLVLSSVSKEDGAVGFAGLHPSRAVKVLPISGRAGQPSVAPTAQTCLSGEYPLAYTLHVYYAAPQTGKVDPLAREFLRFAWSKQGQTIVSKNWAYPIPASVAAEQSRALGR